MSYWDITDRYLGGHGGHGPSCPECGKEMFAADDHGRFRCTCGRGLDVETGLEPPTMPLPQVDCSGLSDAQKALVPPINRLNQPPTAAEAEYFRVMFQGPDAIGTPEYQAAVEAMHRERGE
ncbi:MAG: hypothetical protein RB292_01185 [Patescibacteria group bacterium]|jgi:hypothetical protein|nr:hypothetical protein [Patescibacteria group bacterium]